MSEYTIKLPVWHDETLELVADAINNPDLLHDMVYEAFRARVSNWAEHGWELHAVVRGEHIFVTARRKT